MGNVESIEKNNVHSPDWQRECHTCKNTGQVQHHIPCSNCNGQGHMGENHIQQQGDDKICNECKGRGQCKMIEQCKDC